MIAYKNPMTYVLGYYTRNIPQIKGIQQPLSNDSKSVLNIVEFFIKNDPYITLVDVIKYAQLWNMEPLV